MTQTSRRAFLRQLGALSTSTAAIPLGLNLSAITQAAAQSAGGSGYRALVCIYLSGGNDAYNTVLATDDTSWGHYLHHRQAQDGGASIALPLPGVAADPSAAGTTAARLGGVLAIGHGNRSVHSSRQFALHPALPQVQQMYQAGRVAILANVGPLNRPLSKADYANDRIAKPAKLFSHNDQTSTWQTFKPEGTATGWAGLMGDTLMSGNGAGHSGAELDLIRKSFTCMSPTSGATWLAGRSVMPFQTGNNYVLSLGYSSQIYDNVRLQAAAASMLGKLGTNGSPKLAPRNVFASDIQKIAQRSLQASDLLGNQLAPLGTGPWSTASVTNAYNDPLLKYVSPVDGSLKFNLLAMQLQMVARLIATNQSAGLGMSRQFFMVNVGGFDTHSTQISDQADRLAQLNHAMAYFDTVLSQMPGGDLRNNVTSFTASDFGRTFTSNGDGTDHGWGGHHFIMGGAVNGTEVYGTFPQYSTANNLGVFSSPDQLQNGVLLPSTSVDHYAYTLGRWMGVPDATLVNNSGTGILPNLSQFSSGSYDLGFMKA